MIFMKKNPIRLMLCLFCYLVFTGAASSQLDSVKYMLRYNANTDEFDMFVIVVGGSAMTLGQRTQANAIISIIVPTGSSVEVTESYMPLRNNQNYQGSEPNDWSILSFVVNPVGAPGFDFHGIVPSLSPASQYNNLSAGDTIRLFSLKIGMVGGCFEDVRLLDNDEFYPVNLGGGDFSNGFTVGGFKQLYRGNIEAEYPDIAGPDIEMEERDTLVLAPGDGGGGVWTIWSDKAGLEIEETAPGQFSVTTSEDAYGPYTLKYQNGDLTDFVCVNVLSSRIHFFGNPLICNGVPAEVTADFFRTASFVWSNGTSGKKLSTSVPGIYKVKVYPGDGSFFESSVEIYDSRTMLLTEDKICLGERMALPDDFKGIWASDNTEVLAVENSGFITGIQSGTANLVFTFEDYECEVESGPVEVIEKPVIRSEGDLSVCIRDTLKLLTDREGSWKSVNPGIADISELGVVIGISTGKGSILFSEALTGCISDTFDIEVSPSPFVTNQGKDTLCIDQTTRLFPSEGGIWASLDENKAQISGSGVVRTFASGYVEFVYYSDTMVCPAYMALFVDDVTPGLISPVAYKTGGVIRLSSASQGVWTTSHEQVIDIRENSRAVILRPGFAVLHFASFSGCQADFPIGMQQSEPEAGKFPDGQFQDDRQVYFRGGDKGDDAAIISCVLFPNPANRHISVVSKGDIEKCEVYDIQGSVLLQLFHSFENIDVSGFSAGQYYMRIFCTQQNPVLLPFIVSSF